MEKLMFKDLNCSEEVLKAIEEMGFEEATPIQKLSIPIILEGKDIVGHAQTGTGKTAAFGIPVTDKIDINNKKIQVLVLCPTRELALQVSEEFSKISKFKKGIRILPVFGGQPIERQIKALKKGVHVIIGTPGRVLDHIRRKTIKLDGLEMLILDEADEMLNMGFREDIESVIENTVLDRQTLLFSATMPKAILDIIDKYQKNPEILKVVHKELTTPNIDQLYLEVKMKDKVEVLTRLLDVYNPKRSMIFCNTKKKVDEVTDLLQTRGYTVDKIHGDMNQSLRINVINKFKKGDLEALVATDVAARGLDIENVEIVFNFDMPSHEEYYVHRIGRTGRAGKTGTSFTFVTPKDYYLLKNVMRYTKKKINRHPIPTIDDIETIKTNNFIKKIKNKINEGNLTKYLKIVEDLTEDDIQSIEIAAALLKMELEVTNANEIDGFKSSNENSRMVRLFISIGRSKKIKPKDIVKSISNETSLSDKKIGDIDIFDNFSFVDIPEEYAEEVISIMHRNIINGSKVSIERAKNNKKKRRNRKQYSSR